MTRAWYAVLIVVTFVLGVPAGAGLPYLQYQYDAARTGAVSDPGPDHMDRALTIRLPGAPVYGAAPLIMDDDVYMLVRALPENSWARTTGLVRANVHDGAIETLYEVTGLPSGLASDGSRFYLQHDGLLVAYDLEQRSPGWTLRLPAADLASTATTFCGHPAIAAGTLYLPCTLEPDATTGAGLGEPGAITGPVHGFLLAVNLTSGEVDWRWDATSPDAAARDTGTYVLGVSVIGEWVFATGYETSETRADRHTWRLARDSGTLAEDDPFPGIWSTGPLWYPDLPSVTGDSLQYYQMDIHTIQAHDSETGEVQWRNARLGREIPPDGNGGGIEEVGYQFDAMALRGDRLFVAASSQLVSLRTDGNEDWVRDVGLWEGNAGALVAGSTLYIGTWPGGDTARIRAYSIDDGTERGSDTISMGTFSSRPNIGGVYTQIPTVSYGVGEGVLALAGAGGDLQVYGHTRASIQLSAEVADMYPAIGAPAVVDLSRTQSGLQSQNTEFRVQWGDDFTSAWSTEPYVEHAYQEAGTYTAIVEARNDAGQTSRTFVEFEVGGSAPAELTFLQQAFAPSRQDTTWGVIGVSLTLLGALFALLARRSRRSRLQRELAAIDRVYEAHKHDPPACASELRRRHERIRELLVNGAIEDGHFTVLERTILDYSRTIRVHALDRDFGFLPLDIARTLERFLADGRISTWERDRFLDALANERGLTKTQRNKVAALVEQWLRDDVDLNAERA